MFPSSSDPDRDSDSKHIKILYLIRHQTKNLSDLNPKLNHLNELYNKECNKKQFI